MNIWVIYAFGRITQVKKDCKEKKLTAMMVDGGKTRVFGQKGYSYKASTRNLRIGDRQLLLCNK